MTMPDATSKRKRSPNYPGIDLGVAVDRAKTLWENEQHHAVPYEVIVKHWGYGAKSSGGSLTFAALRRFGLLDAEGKSHGRLSDRGLNIVKAELENARNYDLLQQAALLPRTHRELWDEYGAQLPSDESLKWRLIQQGFTPGGASDFISEWKQTMAFARLESQPVNVSAATEGSEDQLESAKPSEAVTPTATPAAPPAPTPVPSRPIPGVASYPIPLKAGLTVTLTGPFPLDEAGWTRMLTVLDALKPGLVEPDDSG